MSETSNGMPDLISGDNEPSMEDILASIRQIIAEDKTEQTAFDNESEELVAEVEDDLVVSSFSEKMDEEAFEIPEIEGASQSFDDLSADLSVELTEDLSSDISEVEVEDEILDLINFADTETDNTEQDEQTDGLTDELTSEPKTTFEESADLVDELVDDESLDFEPATGDVESSFDESLDLVMDSDASDYFAENTESEENRLLREEIEQDLSLDDETLDSLELDVEDQPTAPDLEALLETELADDDDGDFADLEALVEAGEDPEELVGEDIATHSATTHLDGAASTGDDQDMDLVKSLLADLMEEPDNEEFGAEVGEAIDEATMDDQDDETAQADNILDEILYQSMDDEVSVADGSDVDDESELAAIARNARQAAASTQETYDDIRAEDTVALPERDLENRLTLNTKAGFAAAGFAVAGAGASVIQEDEDEAELAEIEELLELIEEVDAEEAETVQEDPDEIEMLVEQIAEEVVEEALQEIDPPQEETMVRAVKTETLLDNEIEQESSEAFAALSHVVQEKAELEENGPAIGDLVQDALRPMLKEWLDKNLKGIVERAVTKEVKRISAGK